MNGFDFDGLVIYGRHPDNPALDLVEMNLTYRDVEEMSRYVVLADDGVVQHVFEPATGAYWVIDSFSADVDAGPLSFNGLLMDAFERHPA